MERKSGTGVQKGDRKKQKITVGSHGVHEGLGLKTWPDVHDENWGEGGTKRLVTMRGDAELPKNKRENRINYTDWQTHEGSEWGAGTSKQEVRVMKPKGRERNVVKRGEKRMKIRLQKEESPAQNQQAEAS